MPEYAHGGDIYSYQEKYGRVPIDFSSNINPLGLQKAVLAALCEAAIHADRYPDARCTRLIQNLAEFEQIPQDWILCGNGAADLIYRTVYARRPKRALLLSPTFSEYEAALRAVKCRVQFYRLKEETGFVLTPDFLKELDCGYDMIFLCNPNNPTGQVIDPGLMRDILDTCRENGVFVVVDECFLDFSERRNELTVKGLLSEYPGLLIIKAFTKTFALAGARLGYLFCSDHAVREQIAKAGQPWAVSNLAQEAGVAALQNAGEYLQKSRIYVERERELLRYGLTCCGYQVFDSQANYLLFCSKDTDLAGKMKREGFLIRDCENYHGLKPGYYRIAVRRHEDNVKLLSALERL